MKKNKFVTGVTRVKKNREIKLEWRKGKVIGRSETVENSSQKTGQNYQHQNRGKIIKSQFYPGKDTILIMIACHQYKNHKNRPG